MHRIPFYVGLSLPPFLQGVAVGPSGAIYVTGNGANQVLRIGS